MTFNCGVLSEEQFKMFLKTSFKIRNNGFSSTLKFLFSVGNSLSYYWYCYRWV